MAEHQQNPASSFSARVAELDAKVRTNPFRSSDGQLRRSVISETRLEESVIVGDAAQVAQKEPLPFVDYSIDVDEMFKELEQKHERTLYHRQKAHEAHLAKLQCDKEDAIRRAREGCGVPRATDGFPRPSTGLRSGPTNNNDCVCCESVAKSMDAGEAHHKVADAVNAAFIASGGSARCTLGLCSDRGPSNESVRRRYYQLSLVLHPDKNTGDNFEAAFRSVGSAYAEVLDGTDFPASQGSSESNGNMRRELSREEALRQAEAIMKLYEEIQQTVFTSLASSLDIFGKDPLT